MDEKEIRIIDIVYRSYYEAYKTGQMIGTIDVAQKDNLSIDDVKRSILFLEAELKIEFDNKGFDPVNSGPIYKLTKYGFSWFSKTNYVTELNVNLGTHKPNTMKIFISHASANKEYGNALVDLLTNIGVKDDQIIFTSNVAHGIPNGANIFDWLKSQIAEESYVIYLLSKEYYQSVACLNEMGAAWIVGNEASLIFLPEFDLESKAFQNGAIDPRKLGFYINDNDRILRFYEDLKKFFPVTENLPKVINSIKKFLGEIAAISGNLKMDNTRTEILIEDSQRIEDAVPIIKPMEITVEELKQFGSFPKLNSTRSIYDKFLTDVISKKLIDAELLIFHYIIDTAKIRLGTGWQTDSEIEFIRSWEDVNDLNNNLSSKYKEVLRRFQLKKYTVESDWTSHNNPKEVTLISEISENIFDLPDYVKMAIDQAVYNNPKPTPTKVDDLPF